MRGHRGATSATAPRALGPDEPRHLHPRGPRFGQAQDTDGCLGWLRLRDLRRLWLLPVALSQGRVLEVFCGSAAASTPEPAWNHALNRGRSAAEPTGEDRDDLLSAEPGPGGWEELARMRRQLGIGGREELPPP